MRQVAVTHLLSDSQKEQLLERMAGEIPGSEWYEALVRTSLRYPVPWHGHPSRWDWGVMLKSLSLAIQKHEQLRETAKEMGPAVWLVVGDDGERLRKALRS